jgi:hypothetical protein
MRIQKQANTGMNTHGVLLIWRDPKLHWHGEATGTPGRTPTFSDAAVQFCLAVKRRARRAAATGHAGDEKVASGYSLELADTQLQHDKPSAKSCARSSCI